MKPFQLLILLLLICQTLTGFAQTKPVTTKTTSEILLYHQIVTDDDATELSRALQRARASIELILFLSHGAFRIAG